MTYGWALIVVLIVIAALAFFGLLDPNRFLPEKCEIAPGVTCRDFNLIRNSESENGTITLLINNGIGQSMNSVMINVTSCENLGSNSCGSSGQPGDDSCTIVDLIEEGNTAVFLINCSGTTASSKFRSDLTVNYSVSLEGTAVSHVKTGYISVMVEGK